MRYLAKTLEGLEEVLSEELSALGAKNIMPVKRAVHFEGDKRLLYRANYELRTALRILVPVRKFSVRNENELYKKVQLTEWSEYFNVNQTFAINSVVYSDYFRHSQYVALKAKDAIVDQFRQRFRKRPNVNILNPDLLIHIHISDDQCSISLDSSGDSLHKRGYRQKSVIAPLNEVLAAGLIKLSGWQKDKDFIDPMCGSGTNLVEAAYYAFNIPPQINRSDFAFKKWKDFDKDLWESILQDAKENRTEFPYRILGYDKDTRALIASRSNINIAGLFGKVKVEQKYFEKLKPSGKTGMLLMNPPYDERLATENIDEFYRMIGDNLKTHFQGFEAWIISANLEALKNIGLHASKKITLFNGQLISKFQKYVLYEGSKKS